MPDVHLGTSVHVIMIVCMCVLCIVLCVLCQ